MTDSIKQKEKLKLALIPLLVICLIGVLTGGNGEGPSTVTELIPPVK